MFDKQLLEIDGACKTFAICGIFSILRALTVLAQALSLSFSICGFWEGGDLLAAGDSLAVFAASFMARACLNYGEEAYLDRFASKATERLLARCLDAAYQGGEVHLKATGTSATAATLIDGSEDVEKYLRLAYQKPCDCIIVPIVLLAAIFSLDVASGFIALILLPFIFIFMRLIGLNAKDEAASRHGQFERLSNSFVDKAKGIVELKSFGADGRFSKLIFESSEAFRRIVMKTLRISMLSSAVLDLFATLALAAVAIMLGFRMVEATVAFFPALAVLVIVPEYFKPIREFGNNYHDTLNGSAAMRAMLDFIEGSRDPQNRSSPFWADSLGGGESGAVTFDIDTSAHTSTTVMGRSGAGKTTFLNALAGLSSPPDDFAFAVDGDAATDLRDESWTRRVAYVTQDPHMFNASIRDNVAFYDPSASEDQVNAALRVVGLASYIEGLPDGISTIVGGEGVGLSGGQIQRMAIARALIDERRDIWILDEPSAHIDAATEAQIQQELLSLTSDKTLFVVTHDESWAGMLDRTIVLDGTGARDEDGPDSAKERP